MRAVSKILCGVGLALLCGCGGGTPLPPGKDVTTPAFESYTTDHNGYSRVRRDNSVAGDAAILAQFEDSNPADPAGYRDLIDLADTVYEDTIIVEVIAEVETSGGTETVKRVLRLTADQAPFENVKNGALVTATGKYYFRGQNFVWVSIGGGPILSGSDSDGLVDMVLDFDAETVDLNLRTGVSSTSAVRTEITASDLPFNIISGAYGGAITVQVWDPGSSTIYAIDGSLRGNIGGSPTYTDSVHGMTTSGVYTATTSSGTAVVVDGVYVGVDPNALP